MEGIELAEMIAQLRSEFQQAATAAEADDGQRFGFEVGPIELTLSVQVSREATPGAKVRFWVVEAGAEVTSASASTQQVRLSLTPVDTTDPHAPAPPPGSVRVTGTNAPNER